MKIIDLLNKIANGKELPKRFKFMNRTFNKALVGDEWLSEDGYSFTESYDNSVLNNEIEIIEDKKEKKIPEKLNLDTDELKGKETPRAIDYLIESKINQVIDYLKSKGDE